MAQIKCKVKNLNSYTVFIKKENGEFKALTEVPFKAMLYLKTHSSTMSRTAVRYFVTKHRKSLVKNIRCSIIWYTTLFIIKKTFVQKFGNDIYF